MSAGKSTREPGRGRWRHRACRCSPPGRHRFRRTTLIPEQGTIFPRGLRARRFASSLITVMIRKEGTYVRAMRLAPACQLMLDIPGPERGPGRDPGQVWDQMPDVVQARVLRLLAAMIAAGVVIDAGAGAWAVRGDG